MEYWIKLVIWQRFIQVALGLHVVYFLKFKFWFFLYIGDFHAIHVHSAYDYEIIFFVVILLLMP